MRILTRRDTGLLTQWTFGTAGSLFDPDAQAFITAAGITDGTQQSAINTLVIALKNASVWSKLEAIYPMVGGTATTHKFNLKNPADTNAAYRLSFVGGWTHSANGALPNGTNAYADTFWLSSQQNSASLSFYSRTNSDAVVHEFGAGLGPISYMLLRFGNLFYGLVNSGTDNTVANTNSTGHYLVTRTASNVIKFFKNGGLTLNATTASTGNPTVNMVISAWRQAPGTLVRYSNRECAFATLGTGLNDTESANLYTAIQAFNTTLGRQV